MVAVAAAALLTTSLGLVSAGPASAAAPTCNGVAVKYTSYGDRMRLPVRTSTSSPTCVMGRGAQSAAVTLLQKELRTYGYDIAADGVFGSRTQAALKDLQRWLGIAADGVYGPQTRDAICWTLYDYAPDCALYA